MGSLNTPKTWAPYMNTKDCSQGFCSLYCPQWCYLVFPPPPPMASSSTTFSPLVITIIGILASAFLLVSYYAVISKFCRAKSRDFWPHVDEVVDNPNYDSNNNDNDNDNDHVDENEPWNSRAAGLDEALIRLISVCKYKKGDKAFSSSDCSVCLGEFEEGEALRILPKCCHAFHVSCIDKWLKTQSSCPLCRSNIVSMFTLEAIQQGLLMNQDQRMGAEQEELQEVVVLPDEIVEIRDDAELRRSTSRSVSMDRSRERRISIEEDENCEIDEVQLHGSSSADHMKNQPSMGEEAYNRVMQCVMRPSMIKRSFSSGRFSFTRHTRGRNSAVLV